MYSPRRVIPEGRASPNTQTAHEREVTYLRPRLLYPASPTALKLSPHLQPTMPKGKKNSRGPRRPRRASARAVSSRMVTASTLGRLGSSVPLTGFPDKIWTDLAYNTQGRTNPGVVAYADNVFDLNNLFDPERTGTGHQPREFDSFAALYLHYRVFEADIEVEIRQRASHGIRAVLIASNTATALTPSDFPAEERRAQISNVTGSSQPAIRMRRRVRISDVLGMSAEQYRTSEDTDAPVTSAPDQLAHLHMYVEQVDGSTACDFEYTMRIVFRSQFFDKKDLSPSAVAEAAAGAGYPSPLPPSLGAPSSTFVVVGAATSARSAPKR